MTKHEVQRRYPRLIRVMNAIAQESDPGWATSVIEEALSYKNRFARSLVREAWKLRHEYTSGGTEAPLRGIA